SAKYRGSLAAVAAAADAGAAELGAGVAGAAPEADGLQRMASATTMPSALSDSTTPWFCPDENVYVPSERQAPPPLRWSTLTGAAPLAPVTRYVALLARLAPLVQRANTS